LGIPEVIDSVVEKVSAKQKPTEQEWSFHFNASSKLVAGSSIRGRERVLPGEEIEGGEESRFLSAIRLRFGMTKF
jgi:hypothetical protein